MDFKISWAFKLRAGEHTLYPHSFVTSQYGRVMSGWTLWVLRGNIHAGSTKVSTNVNTTRSNSFQKLYYFVSNQIYSTVTIRLWSQITYPCYSTRGHCCGTFSIWWYKMPWKGKYEKLGYNHWSPNSLLTKLWPLACKKWLANYKLGRWYVKFLFYMVLLIYRNAEMVHSVSSVPTNQHFHNGIWSLSVV